MNPAHLGEAASLIVMAVTLAMSTAMWMWQTEWGQSSIVFFGVRVPERFEDSLEAMPIRLRYENTVKLIPVVLFVLYGLVMHFTPVPIVLRLQGASLSVVVLQGLGVRVAYWRARNETLPFAAQPETTRSANFVEMAGPGVLWKVSYWSAVVLPVLVLLGMAAYTWTHWLALHLPVATNVQLPLTVDSPALTWKRVDVLAEMRWVAHALLANAIAILVAFAFNFRSRVNEWGEEETDRRSYRRQLMVFAVVMQWLVVFNCVLLLLVDVVRATPLFDIRHNLLTFMMVLAVLVSVEAILPLWLMYRLYENRPPGFVNKSDDQHWKFGLYYVNPADSAAVVPTRFGVGESLNLGHPLVWGIGVLSVAMFAMRYVHVLMPVRVSASDSSASSLLLTDLDLTSFVADAESLKHGEFAASERLLYLGHHSPSPDLKTSVAVVLAQNHVKPTASTELAITAASLAESRTHDSSHVYADELPHLAALWSNAGFVCLQQKHRSDGCASRYLAAAESLDPHTSYANLLTQANAADPTRSVMPMPADVTLHLEGMRAGDTALNIVLSNQHDPGIQNLLESVHGAPPMHMPGNVQHILGSSSDTILLTWAQLKIAPVDGSRLDWRTAETVLDALSFPWPDRRSIELRLRGELHCVAGGNCSLHLQPVGLQAQSVDLRRR